MTRILFVADADVDSPSATRAVRLIIGLPVFRARCSGGELLAPIDLASVDALALVRVYELRRGAAVYRTTCCVQRALAGMWSHSAMGEMQ